MAIEEIQLSHKEIMESMIDSAQLIFLEAEKIEADNDYEDALESMERCEADGYVNGLQSAYKVFFGDFYESDVTLSDLEDN